MNILVWSSRVARPVGGQERVALGLALHLHQRSHKVVLVGAYDNAPELCDLIPPEMAYHFFDFHRPRFKPHMAAARRLSRIIADHNIQIVSAHGNVFGLFAACRQHNVPLVWTIHGAEPRPGGLLGRMKTLAVIRVMSNACTQVVAVSNATADIIQRQFPRLDPGRLHVIHNGIIDEDSLRALPLPQAGPPWRLGFVGRLAERKRPLDLVEVAKRLEGKLEFRFEIFGDGPLLAPLREAIAAARLEHRFTLHGYWDKASAGMMQQFQILVHPDSVEPFGGALLESQLSGRPVVAYRVGGNPEIVEHARTGWLVPLADAAGLADGVLRVAGQDFSIYSAAARERAEKKFSTSRMIDEYLALFERTCASR
jgi:glycosyltransferase involved in cell wall biosynthesis